MRVPTPPGIIPVRSRFNSRRPRPRRGPGPRGGTRGGPSAYEPIPDTPPAGLRRHHRRRPRRPDDGLLPPARLRRGGRRDRVRGQRSHRRQGDHRPPPRRRGIRGRGGRAVRLLRPGARPAAGADRRTGAEHVPDGRAGGVPRRPVARRRRGRRGRCWDPTPRPTPWRPSARRARSAISPADYYESDWQGRQRRPALQASPSTSTWPTIVDPAWPGGTSRRPSTVTSRPSRGTPRPPTGCRTGS